MLRFNRSRHRASPGILSAGGLAIVSILLILSGCETYNTDPNPGLLDETMPWPRIIINDDELARGLRFDEPVVVRDELGFITRVEITARALSTNTLKVDYRGRFKGENGALLQPEAAWRTKFLEARVPETVVLLPPARNAMDYEVQFRWAR